MLRFSGRSSNERQSSPFPQGPLYSIRVTTAVEFTAWFAVPSASSCRLGAVRSAWLTYCKGGSWFGYGPIITRRQRILGFAAVEPSVALHVPLGALDKLATSDPGNLRALLTMREYGMDIAIATVADLLIPAVDKRIAATLLRCAAFSAAEPGRPLVVSGLTQAQIGELANAARDVVNRTLKRLEAKGWIEVSYRKITLLDPPALDSFCSSVGKLQQAPTAERCPPY